MRQQGLGQDQSASLSLYIEQGSTLPCCAAPWPMAIGPSASGSTLPSAASPSRIYARAMAGQRQRPCQWLLLRARVLERSEFAKVSENIFIGVSKSIYLRDVFFGKMM